MFIFIGGVLYSLDPPNAYLWGGPDPPGNRRAWLKHTLAGGKAILISLFSICNGLLNCSYSVESCIFTLIATQIS